MTDTPTDILRGRVEASVDAHLPAAIELSEAIHADPELSFEEERAAARVAAFVRERDFDVIEGPYELPTSLEAKLGPGPLAVCFCAEYDALPEVGHACGHNLIAATSALAAIALAAVAEESGVAVTLLGTPAEELGTGKPLLIDRGAFADVHMALMVHPAPMESTRLDSLAVSQFTVTFQGREAHASTHPHEGINAADAWTIAQVAIGLLRQQLPAGIQVHGAADMSGHAANVIPGRVSGEWHVRAATLAQALVAEKRVKACLQAGALASGCDIAIEPTGPPLPSFRDDDDLERLYGENVRRLGREPASETLTGATDMANVSQVVPAIHPVIRIETGGAFPHERAFAASCVGASAQAAIRDGAKALALTALDAALDPGVRARLLADGAGS